MSVTEQVSSILDLQVELHKTTQERIKACRRIQRLAKALEQSQQQLNQVHQRITSLTNENQRLRELL